MSRIDLYPSKNSPPADAEIQTGTVIGTKVAADAYVVGGAIGTAVTPADYDQADVLYPDAVTETYIYRKDGNIIRSVTITYTSAAKTNISGWIIL